MRNEILAVVNGGFMKALMGGATVCCQLFVIWNQHKRAKDWFTSVNMFAPPFWGFLKTIAR